jgi:hypothetical protein
MTPDELKKLREKRDALNARIRQAEARETKKRRDEDTSVKVWIGAAVKWQSEREPECMAWLRKLFFDFYPGPEKHANKHEIFSRLVVPVDEKTTPAGSTTPQA